MATNDPLLPVEKGLILRAIPVFSDVSAGEIVGLASIATEMRLEAGSQLFGEQDPPALYALISGEILIQSERNESPLHAGASDVIGIYETLAGLPFEHCASVTRAGFALRIDRDDLFDLLSQRPGLLQQIFGALFRSRAAGRFAAAN
jgi:CRP-like cAMP-binding protein